MEQECSEQRRNSKTEQFIPKTKNHVVIKTDTPEHPSMPNSEDGKGGKRQPNWVHVWPQVLASCIALSTTVQAGINLAFSSVLLPQLEEDPDVINLTEAEASWIASVVTIGTLAGALVVGPVMDLIGRKSTCVLSNIPMLLSWILTFTTKNNIWPLYLARACAGFGAGMTTVALVYTAEIAHKLYRPMLLSLNSVFVAFGIMVTNVLGAYVTWRTMALLFGLLCIFSFSLCLVLPESPDWLVTFTPSDKRTAQALEELQKLNRPTWLFQEECKRLKETLNERKNTQSAPDKSHFLVKIWKKRGEIINASVILPLITLIILFILQQLSGIYVIIFYSVKIFEKIVKIDKYTGTVLLGILRFVMSIVAAGLSRIYGRRPLMIVSSFGMAITCGLAASIVSISGGEEFKMLGNSAASVKLNNSVVLVNSTFDSFNSTNITNPFTPEETDYNAITIITVGLILLYTCFGAIGHLVIPWTLISELMPNHVRAMGSSFMIFCAYILMFLVVKTFLPLLEAVGIANILFFYALISFLTAPFTYFYIPETLGKTFKEISKSFRRTNR